MNELLERAISQLNNAATAYQSWGEHEKAQELQELAEQLWSSFGGGSAEASSEQLLILPSSAPVELSEGSRTVVPAHC